MSKAVVTGNGPLIEFTANYRQWSKGDTTDMYPAGHADALIRRHVARYVEEETKAIDAPPKDKRVRRKTARRKRVDG